MEDAIYVGVVISNEGKLIPFEVKWDHTNDKYEKWPKGWVVAIQDRGVTKFFDGLVEMTITGVSEFDYPQEEIVLGSPVGQALLKAGAFA